MRHVMRTLSAVLLTACATSRQSQVQLPNDEPGEPAYRPAQVTVRSTSWEDPELAAKGLGRMEFVIRVSGRPAQTIRQAQVLVHRVGDPSPWKQAMTDDRGVAAFDSMTVGRYQLTVRAIGYGPAKSETDVLPGCRTDVEVYIGIQAIGIAPPPPEPGRIHVTTCRASR